MFHCWKERNEVETSPSIFPDPAGGYKYPETKNVSAILYRRSPFERPCRVADTKRLCFRTTFLPVSTLRQSVLDFALPHAARPSLRRTGGDLANSWFSPASHTTNFYLQTAPDKFVHPENKKGCKHSFATQPTFRSFAEREGFEQSAQSSVYQPVIRK